MSSQKVVDLLKENQKVVVLVGLSAVLIVAYLALKANASEERVLFKTAEMSVAPSRILGEPNEYVTAGKEAKLDKAAKELSRQNVDLQKRLVELEEKIEALKEKPVVAAAESKEGPDGSALAQAAEVPGGASSTDRIEFQKSTEEFAIRGADRVFGSRRKEKAGPKLISFPVASEERADEVGPGIPSGSFVKGIVLTGVDAHQEEWPVLIQLDYAFIGPNESRIDLSGCFVIAKAKGDLSIERVIMQTEKISCVSQGGEMFERAMNGWVNDDHDNRFGVTGPVNSKRDRVMSAAFLASIVSGIGKALQQAESTTQTTPLGGSQTALTGDQGAYLAGGAAASAGSRIAEWYLKQAEGLLPSITIGSGKLVWIAVKDKVSLPNTFFRPTLDTGGQSEKPFFMSGK